MLRILVETKKEIKELREVYKNENDKKYIPLILLNAMVYPVYIPVLLASLYFILASFIYGFIILINLLFTIPFLILVNLIMSKIYPKVKSNILTSKK